MPSLVHMYMCDMRHVDPRSDIDWVRPPPLLVKAANFHPSFDAALFLWLSHDRLKIISEYHDHPVSHNQSIIRHTRYRQENGQTAKKQTCFTVGTSHMYIPLLLYVFSFCKAMKQKWAVLDGSGSDSDSTLAFWFRLRFPFHLEIITRLRFRFRFQLFWLRFRFRFNIDSTS